MSQNKSRMLPVKYSAKDNELRALKNRVKYLNDLIKETLNLNEKLRKEKKDLETKLLEKDVEIDVLKENEISLNQKIEDLNNTIEFINEIEG